MLFQAACLYEFSASKTCIETTGKSWFSRSNAFQMIRVNDTRASTPSSTWFNLNDRHKKMSLVSRLGGCKAKQCQHAKAWKVLGNPIDFNDSHTEQNALETSTKKSEIDEWGSPCIRQTQFAYFSGRRTKNTICDRISATVLRLVASD